MTCNDDVDEETFHEVWCACSLGRQVVAQSMALYMCILQNRINIYHQTLIIKMLTREPVAFFCYFSSFELMTKGKKEIIEKIRNLMQQNHYWYYSAHLTIPHICHGSHGYTRVNFFLAGVKFYRFNAKNWHFRQNLREKLAFFYIFNAKNGRFLV